MHVKVHGVELKKKLKHNGTEAKTERKNSEKETYRETVQSTRRQRREDQRSKQWGTKRHNGHNFSPILFDFSFIHLPSLK